MIKVSVFYPSGEGKTFDMRYYHLNHLPMVRNRLGAACKNAAIEEGLGGPEPGSAPTYAAMGHLYFDSLDAFAAAWAPHANEIIDDVKNYTNIEPVIQISKVVL